MGDSDRFVDMLNRLYLLFCSIGLFLLPLVAQALWQPNLAQQGIPVAMRAIGHQVLIAHGDSTSRILPVQQVSEAQYIISFDTEFQLNTFNLINAIHDVVVEYEISSSYFVEMQECHTEAVIYSYRVLGKIDLNSIPCVSREQISTCYRLKFTLDQEQSCLEQEAKLNNDESTLLSTVNSPYLTVLMWILVICSLPALMTYYYRNKSDNDPHIVNIGTYRFDMQKMILSVGGEEIELTSKESDLLALLHASANTTIQRDDILHKVWGDKGDYIGRTLDVFISKLRKKLAGDPNIKITNIRGVGYRLILDPA